MIPLSIENLSFTFGGPPVLNDVNLEVGDGEFLGVVGPNGGGKSTLLRIILGLLAPDSGTIRVFGESPRKSARRIGYVPQFSKFRRDFPISVKDVVLMGRLSGRMRPGPYSAADQEAANEAMKGARILDLENRHIDALSGGQLQRVLIARALATNPDMLLLDEPTASIDTNIEESIFELLRELNSRMTILLVSHDVGFISRYVTRVACLNRQLVCHQTSDLDAKGLAAVYGSPVQLIDHDSHLPTEAPE
jgi:zinc transport system ATP-binding protein